MLGSLMTLAIVLIELFMNANRINRYRTDRPRGRDAVSEFRW